MVLKIINLNDCMNPPRNTWKEAIQPIGHRVNLSPIVIVVVVEFVVVVVVVIEFLFSTRRPLAK